MTNMQVNGWLVRPESDGFQNSPTNLGGIAKFLCLKNGQLAGFAFAVSLFERAVNPNLTDAELMKQAENKIKEYLSEDQVSDRDELTFIFENDEFRKQPNAKWWNKTL
ncbi:MAG: hypothetical protein Q7R60_01925 [bacterium]|nr:hypothetical protein [bacterium]